MNQGEELHMVVVDTEFHVDTLVLLDKVCKVLPCPCETGRARFEGPRTTYPHQFGFEFHIMMLRSTEEQLIDTVAIGNGCPGHCNSACRRLTCVLALLRDPSHLDQNRSFRGMRHGAVRADTDAGYSSMQWLSLAHRCRAGGDFLWR